FQLAVQHGSTETTSRARLAESWNGFMSFLKAKGVVRDYVMKLKDFSTKQFTGAGVRTLSRLNENHPIRIDWEKSQSEFDFLISGHWFCAFAYSIIIDHLERLGSDYETYTLVQYSAPRDVIRSAGDFDVIARTGSKVLMVECKSGSLKLGDERATDVPIVI